jgi:hypothetical protein
LALLVKKSQRVLSRRLFFEDQEPREFRDSDNVETALQKAFTDRFQALLKTKDDG